MGCHTWIYKKASSYTKEELYDLLNERYLEYCNSPIFNRSKDEYATLFVELATKAKEAGISDDEYNCYYADRDTYEKVYKVWNKYQEEKEYIKQCIDKIVSSNISDIKAIYDICTLMECYQIKIRFYNNEYYILQTDGDNIFRCHEYANKPITSYDKMIEYLNNVPSGLIRRNGKPGLTDELRKIIKELYKNNDILIKFA